MSFLTVLGLRSGCAQTLPSVVIHEFMFHPTQPVDGPEPVGEEFVELYNRSSASVDLGGWRLVRGVDYVFPSVILPAGGYLVVAADKGLFEASHPGVSPVVGGWTGSLGNRWEGIRLEDAVGRKVDEVDYATSGDWARRVKGPFLAGTRGWDWENKADGLGYSMERVDPDANVNTGQNWAVSLFPGGTPGGTNTVHRSGGTVFILDVTHAPALPAPGDQVAVRARLVRTGGTEVVVGRVKYRVASVLTPGVFADAELWDDGLHGDDGAGDGVYGALLPAQPEGTVVEFYVEAGLQGGEVRTWPAPALNESDVLGQWANAQYQVDSGGSQNGQPIYRLIMTESERVRLRDINRSSDAEVNATLITQDGAGTEIRYLCGVRIRGAGSRSRTPPNHRVSIPSDHRWKGLAEINLNTQYTHSQLAGLRLAAKAGALCAEIRAVQVRINGVNPASSGLPQYGSYVYVEPFGPDWADRVFPEDGGGNLYRASVGNHTATLSVLTDKNNAISRGYTKSSNSSADDWSDLVALTQVLDLSTDAEYAARVRDWVDVDSWMNYFAVMSLLTTMETSLATGRGDDYSLYRGVLDPRFRLIVHDLDTVMGQGDTAGELSASLFRMVPAVNSRANTLVLNRFMRHPDFVPLYFRQLVNLISTTFSPEQLNPFLDSTLGGFVPKDVIEQMKQFQAARNAAVLAQIPMSLSVTSSVAMSNGFYRVTGSNVTLTGFANALWTKRVVVNDREAEWVAWRGAWTVTNMPVDPGMHRWTVTSFDEAGSVLEQRSVDVWRDGVVGVTRQGVLSADQVWLAGAGPHGVQGVLTVPAGVTLTIGPGATVYFQAGSSLLVRGTLRVEGTPEHRVWMGSNAGGGAPWNGIQVESGSGETRILNVDFQGATGGSHQVGAVNSRLVVDGCTWTGGNQGIVELNNSSAWIRRSIFPNITGAEHIHGGPVPVGGEVVIEGNTFGTTTLLNDIIDFTGARRPGIAVQIRDNVFLGASDDVLDLDGTDALIEGNVFMHVHKGNPNVGDTSSAISYGADGGYGPHVVAVRNFFYDVDHVALCKEGGFLTLQQNTAFGIGIAAVNFSEPERNTKPGSGALLTDNIFFNPPGWTATNLQNRFPTNGVVQVTALRNVVLGGALDVVGSGNGVLDPEFELGNTNLALVTGEEVRNGLRLKPGSRARGAGAFGGDPGADIPAWAHLAGEPERLTPLNSAVLNVGGAAISNYVYRLDGGAWSVETSVATPIRLNNLTAGDHFVEVRGRNVDGYWQSEAELTRSRTWKVVPGSGAVRISEILARNEQAISFGGEYPDWVELQNTSGQFANLEGYGLTDDAERPYRYRFPAGSGLAGGGFWVGRGDKGPAAEGHLGFALSASGGILYLFHPDGHVVDQVEYGVQARDLSLARLETGDWGLGVPTPGVANRPRPVGEAQQLKINEWLALPRTLDHDDFIELYNTGSAPVELSGMSLTDQWPGVPQRHVMAARSYLNAGDYLKLSADGNVLAGADHLSFGLNSEQGMIFLLDVTGAVVDCVSYGPQVPDVSEGRSPNGSGGVGVLSVPTPGSANPLRGTGVEVTTEISAVFGFETEWRYDPVLRDLGEAWRQPGYADGSWPLGMALFGVENNTTYPIPFTTPLPLENGHVTYYFRKHFSFAGSTEGVRLWTTNLVDEGAAIFLNGFEGGRIRLPAGATASTLATGSPTPEGSYDIVELPVQHLVTGDNVLAVEIHQISANSPDVAFAMALSAVRTSTNVAPRGLLLNEVLASNGTLVRGTGGTPDWVEIYNDSDTARNLAGCSLSDDAAKPKRWVFPSGVILGPRAYLVVNLDSDAPASLVAGGELNAGFGLNDRGDQLFLYDAPERGGVLLDSVTFGLQAADFSLGRHVSGTELSWKLDVPTPGGPNIAASLGSVASLKVNEWMANPSSGDDWFELYNPLSQPVALGGMHLTDDLAKRDKFTVAPLSFVGAFTNGLARFVADDQTAKGPDHVNFKLSNNGEALGVFTAGGALIDSVTFGVQVQGVSQGRLPDGGAEIVSFAHSATPGDSNYLPLQDVVIHEVLTHTDPPLMDAVELWNRSGQEVDLGGWYLSDSLGTLRKFRIPDGTRIKAGGFKVFYETDFNPEPGSRTSFSFSSVRGDQVYLSTSDAAGNLLGYRAVAKVGAAPNGVSFGRWEQSLGVDYPLLSARTFGRDTAATTNEFVLGTGASNALPTLGPLVIQEVHYHPPDLGTNDNVLDEFVELYNPGASPVLLYHAEYPTNTWRLRDAVDYVFPMGVSVPAGGYVLVVSFDPAQAATAAAFRSKFAVPAQVPLYGPYGGKLDNSSDSVELVAPDAVQLPPHPDAGVVPYYLVDKIHYGDSAPWPSAADRTVTGVGASLQRRSAAVYGNELTNWVAALPTAGRANAGPMAAMPVVTVQPSDTFSLLGASASFAVTASSPEVLAYQWTYERMAIPGATNPVYTIPVVRSYDAGSYAVLVSGTAAVVRSRDARLSLGGPPVIVSQPQDAWVQNGEGARFEVRADGSAPLVYQWYRDGVLVPGAQGSVLDVVAGAPGASGLFTVQVTNGFGKATSSGVRVRVGLRPSVVQDSVPTVTLLVGGSVNLSAVVNGTAPLEYQWTLEGVDIPGANASTLALNSVQLHQAGRYRLVARNAWGLVETVGTLLDVIPLPSVTVQPVDAIASELGLNPGVFAVTRSYATNQPLTVNMEWSGTAEAGKDYVALPAQVVIPAHATETLVTVTPIQDALVEGPEVVVGTVGAGAGYTLGVPGTATVNLADDDLPDPGRTNVVTLIDWGHVWKYDQTQNLDGAAWTTADYNDSTWPQGPAPLAVEPDGLPIPIATPLTLGRRTYYFRTHFQIARVAGVTLTASNLIDDGAVFHLNGNPWYRIRMPEGAVEYVTSASVSVGNATISDGVDIPATDLKVGDNVLAVEVHQFGANSSDITFAWNLKATIREVASPVLTASSYGADSGLVMQLVGSATADYVVEYSDDLMEWKLLGTVKTESSGRVTVQDPSTPRPLARFYRARVP